MAIVQNDFEIVNLNSWFRDGLGGFPQLFAEDLNIPHLIDGEGRAFSNVSELNYSYDDQVFSFTINNLDDTAFETLVNSKFLEILPIYVVPNKLIYRRTSPTSPYSYFFEPIESVGSGLLVILKSTLIDCSPVVKLSSTSSGITSGVVPVDHTIKRVQFYGDGLPKLEFVYTNPDEFEVSEAIVNLFFTNYGMLPQPWKLVLPE